MTINRKAIYAVFDDADTSSASFAEDLLALGIASKAEAKPLAMQWASQHKKYKAKITKGQRGLMLPRNSAAERAMYRVLDVCYPKADQPKATKKRTANKTDAVQSLLNKFHKLSKAEQRRFLANV